MTLELLLNIDDLNFKVQQFIGSGICQFSKHNSVKHFVFCPNKNSKNYDLDEIKKILLTKKMSSLRVLGLPSINNNIPNDYSFLLELKNLIFIDLSDTEIDTLDYLASMTKLKYLYLNDCENLFLIENEQLKNLLSLTLLDLSGTNIVSIPSEISVLQKLEILNLSSCDRLVSLPESLCHLPSLQILDINNCSKLRKIPVGIGNLKNLKKLDLNFNSSLENIPIFSKKLKYLSLFNLRGFNHQPFSLNLNNLESLNELRIFSCSITNLELSHQIPLEVLFLNYCSDLVDLNFMTHLSNLKKVSLSLRGINTIPASLFNAHKMSYLNIDCGYLKEIPNLFGHLMNLKFLKLLDATNIDKLPSSIGSLNQLVNFEISGFKVEELFEEIGSLRSLKVFEITKCQLLSKICSNILKLKSLVELHINMCPKLKSLPTNLISLPNLEILECSFNNQLKIVPSHLNLGNKEHKIKLQSLILLDIGLISKSFTGQDFKYLSSIQILNLSYNDFEVLPEEIVLVSGLRELILENCQNLITLPKNIFKFKHLEKLNLGGCLNFTELPETNSSKDKLESLENLDLSFTYLKNINFSDHYGDKLEYLNLSNTDISFIPDCIGDFKNLLTLNLYGCRKISTLPERMGNLKKLEFLYLQDCTRFQRLPRDIILCSNLKEINLRRTKCYIDYLPIEFKKKIKFSLAQTSEEIYHSN